MHGQYYTYRLRSTLLKPVGTTERLVADLSKFLILNYYNRYMYMYFNRRTLLSI